MIYSNPQLAIRVLTELQEEINKQAKRRRKKVRKKKNVAPMQH
jgi:hypothetical protein